MTDKEKVKLTIKGAGLSIEREIDEKLASHIISLCLSAKEEKAADNPFDSLFTPQRSERKVSVAEYIDRHAPKRKPDKILTIAGYLSEIKSKDTFHPNEIRGAFRDAGEVLPANFTRDFNWVVSSGWIAKDDEKKDEYWITNTGKKVLSGGFPDEMVKKTRNKVGGSHKKKTSPKKGSSNK